MKPLTASALPRAFKCLASVLHPQVDQRTADNEAGDERHAAKEVDILAGDYGELPIEVADKLATYNNVTPELAMAVDITSGKARVLGRGIKRAYEVTPFEVAGTGDVVAVQADDPGIVTRALVVDWKGFEAVDHPAENKQTMHIALCVARVYGLSEVEVCIAMEARRPVFATLDGFDLDAFEFELRNLYARGGQAGNAVVHEREGEHCKHCNAFAACSKKRTLALDVYGGDASRKLDVLLPLENDDQAARAYELADKLRQLLKRLDAALHSRGAARPIPVRNGMLWGKRVEPGNEELDPDIVYETVRERYGQAIADKAVQRKATKTALKDALRAAGAKPLNKTEEALLTELREKNGVKRKETETWKEFPVT